jgi:hypothetical protein
MILGKPSSIGTGLGNVKPNVLGIDFCYSSKLLRFLGGLTPGFLVSQVPLAPN